MAYNTNPPRAEYTASATQTVFPFLFKIFATSDIKVYKTLAGATPNDATDILLLTTNYTVTINGDSGGEITLASGAAVNDKITLVRELTVTRATEYQQNGDLLASTLNSDQEYQTYLIADNVSKDTRYIKIPDSAQSISTSLPAPIGDAYLKWNVEGNAIENETSVPDAVTTSTANAAAAAASATVAQLFEWEAEAERLTADSYATEAEDTFVNLVTSDGDGTFTYTPTTGYSALHWAAKSMAGDIAPIIHAATSKTTPVDADEFAITDSAATFGLKKLTLGNLKTALGKGVRQTVQNASVSSTGYANYITIGTGLSVNIAATTIPVKIHSAGGDISLDRLGTISTNTTISGLTASAINYLIATVSTNGTIALGKTVLEPIYQFAGTPSVVLDQYTFNIAEMKMYVGNGATASQVWAVCIGRAITDATTVTNLVNFSLNGRFITPASSLLVGATNTGVNHWIGHNLLAVTPILTCLVAQAGYGIGDELPLNIVDSTGNLAVSIGSSSYSCSYSTNVATLYLVTRGASTYTAITPANFNVKFKVTRGW